MIHNGETIAEVNDAFIELFRCDNVAIIDRRVEDIISGADFQALARFRGKYIMQDGGTIEYRQHYEFSRFDRSRFWGESISQRIDEQHYRTVIKWEYEVR